MCNGDRHHSTDSGGTVASADHAATHGWWPHSQPSAKELCKLDAVRLAASSAACMHQAQSWQTGARRQAPRRVLLDRQQERKVYVVFLVFVVAMTRRW